MDSGLIFVNLTGFALIAVIVWWFWLYRPKVRASMEDDLVIRVESGVYQPSQLSVPPHQPVTLQFLRKDPSPCAAQVVFPELGISEELAMDRITTVRLPALQAGRYPFHCQMQMYRGTLEAG